MNSNTVMRVNYREEKGYDGVGAGKGWEADRRDRLDIRTGKKYRVENRN